MSDGAGNVIFYMLLLALPVSALLARRLPLGSVVKMSLAWIAIFITAALLIGQRERLRPLWDRIQDAGSSDDRVVAGSEVRIAMAQDGHFWAEARINGVRRRMLIDSGATTTSLSLPTARAAGVDTEQSPFPVVLNTANGTVQARSATVAELRLGAVTARNLPVVVAASFGDTDVIGMNFLSRLHGWRVEGRTLIMTPSRTHSNFT